jgi:hypothetical protein
VIYYRKKKAQEKQEGANIEELMDNHGKVKDKAHGEKMKKWMKNKEKSGRCR